MRVTDKSDGSLFRLFVVPQRTELHTKGGDWRLLGTPRVLPGPVDGIRNECPKAKRVNVNNDKLHRDRGGESRFEESPSLFM